MKKNSIFLSAGAAAVAVVVFFMFFLLPNCGGKGGKVQSTVKNSFAAVTGKLDPGGNLYLYVGTEKIVKSVDEMAAKLRKIVADAAAKSGEKDTEALNIFDFIYGLVKNCGLMEVSGIGVSSVTIDAAANLNHSKVVIHHYKEKGKGLMWQMMAEKPHALDEQAMLPADTVIAGFADFKMKVLWQWLKNEVAASNLDKVKQGFMAVEPLLQGQGLPLDKILDSLAGRIGFVLSLDDNKKSTIPMGKAALEIPDPAVAIIFSVKDDFLFNLLQSKLPMARKSEEKNVKKLKITLPPMPITLEPTIAQAEGLLIFASNDRLVEAMLTAKAKGNGLTSTGEFKKLAVHIPTQGNNFRFVGSKFFRTVMDIQEKALEAAGEIKDKESPVMKFFNLFDKEMAVYGVSQNSEEGVVFTFNHHLDLEGFILLPVVIPAGVAAAIAIPNFLTAAQKGKQKATMGDMKSVSLAIEAYMVDHGQSPQGASLAEFQDQLQPFYIKVLPLKDAWGNDFVYSHGTGNKKKEYALGSGGKDGVFNGWDQADFYMVTRIEDFNNDIIMASGMFTYGPQVNGKKTR